MELSLDDAQPRSAMPSTSADPRNPLSLPLASCLLYPNAPFQPASTRGLEVRPPFLGDRLTILPCTTRNPMQSNLVFLGWQMQFAVVRCNLWEPV